MNPLTKIFQQIGFTLASTTNDLIQLYQTNPQFQSYINGNLLFFAIYLVYIETKVQGIFFRLDDTNQTRFRPFGFTGFLSYPFRSLDPWKPANWDLNFLIFTQVGALTYMLLQNN